MKIPRAGGAHYEDIRQLWHANANQLSMEYGIFIRVSTEYEGNSTFPQFSRIYFIVMDHEFECLRDLKKALNNKAFL